MANFFQGIVIGLAFVGFGYTAILILCSMQLKEELRISVKHHLSIILALLLVFSSFN